jgi:hypothetical protein
MVIKIKAHGFSSIERFFKRESFANNAKVKFAELKLIGGAKVF